VITCQSKTLSEKLQDLPILSGHALNTGTNTDINHTNTDGIGNVDNCLQSRGTLSVQTLDSSACRETSGNGGGAEFSGTSTWSKDVTDCDVLDKRWVDFGTLDESFESSVEDVSSKSVFEAAFASAGDGCSEGSSYDNLH
jgi:hypothetical protein